MRQNSSGYRPTPKTLAQGLPLAIIWYQYQTKHLNIMKTKLIIPLIAGLGLLCACSGMKKESSADSISTESVQKKTITAKPDTSLNNPKLIKRAEIHFKVKDVRQTSEKISALTASYNGMVIHHVLSSGAQRSQDIRISDDSIMRVTAYNTTADMIVKIPPGKMEDFITQIDLMGLHIDSIRMNIEDKTLDYLTARLKLKNRSLNVIQQAPNDGSVNAKDDLVDRQMNNRRIEDSVKNSIVSLRFYEGVVVNKERLANDDLSSYNVSVFKQLGNALKNGWHVSIQILIALANFWALLPIGLTIWLLVKYYKKRVLVKN